MKRNDKKLTGAVIALTSLLMLSACGSDSSSSDVPGEPELGERTDLLQPGWVSGDMCPNLAKDDVEVYRNGNIVTIKAPKQSGVAEHNPDPRDWNDARCQMVFSVRSDTDFLRRLAGGSITGKYADRTKTDAGYMFSGIVRQIASWEAKDGTVGNQSGSASVSDRDGTASLVSEFTSEMGVRGNLDLAVEVNPAHEGYPVAYTWDGLLRFEITPTR